MAKSLVNSLERSDRPYRIGATLVPAHVAADAEISAHIECFSDLDQLLAWKPTLVVECASHEAVRNSVPTLLCNGIDVVLASVGSLGDQALLQALEKAAISGGSRLIVASGAIGGLDVLRAAGLAGLSNVTYTGTKPPTAWLGTPAEQLIDLRNLKSSTSIFEGNAKEASELYPKNANVTAAVALAGVGFEKTHVTLRADPEAPGNMHEIHAEGAFGSFRVQLVNQPLPENPKTSWLAALSIEQAIVRYFQSVEV